MGIDGSQTLTIYGPKSDIDDIELLFKLLFKDSHWISQKQNKNLDLDENFMSLFSIYYWNNNMCRRFYDPRTIIDFIQKTELMRNYEKFIASEGGKSFKHFFDSKPTFMEAYLELGKHTLLFQSYYRESDNKIIISHAFRNHPTIHFVECLVSFFHNCFFENLCADENGFCEINVYKYEIYKYIPHRRLHLTLCWHDKYSWTPVGPVERYGLRMPKDISEVENDFTLFSRFEFPTAVCGCLELGHSSCLLEDTSRIYNVSIYVGDYYFFFEDYEESDKETMLQKNTAFHETANDVCELFRTRGAVITAPKYECNNFTACGIVQTPFVRQFVGERQRKPFRIECMLKGVDPLKLIQYLCKKYKASFWCDFTDTCGEITGTITYCTIHHYPLPVI